MFARTIEIFIHIAMFKRKKLDYSYQTLANVRKVVNFSKHKYRGCFGIVFLKFIILNIFCPVETGMIYKFIAKHGIR